VVARPIEDVVGTEEAPKNKALTDLYTREQLVAAGVVIRPE